MSGWQTHALVGGVAGWAAAIGLERVGWPEPLATLPPEGAAGVVIGISALAALIPDIDEPGSWIARRARAAVTLGGMGAAAALAAGAGGAIWLAAVAAGVGGLLGWASGGVLLRAIRAGAGGHRRLTHSVILAGVLALAALALHAGGGGWAWMVPAVIAWGIVTHVLADVVTPAGVPLLYPVWRRPMRVLPAPLSTYGEPLIVVVALSVAWMLFHTPR